MTCLTCHGHVPLPDRWTVTSCTACGACYQPVTDLGFFSYSILVFVPAPALPSPRVAP